MARLGVTYQDIANAADQLLGQGRQPTIELIRNLLGTGSTTTIANHLRKWRAEQCGSTSVASKENLPQEFVSVMKGLWQRLQAYADDKITAIKHESEQSIDLLRRELEKYKTNNQRWQQLFNQWQQEKAQLSNDKLILEQAVETLKKDNAAIQSKQDVFVQQLQDKQERIAELHRLHTQAQTNLEHYRESVREQRLIEQHQFEQQKQELQSEIKTLKEQTTVMREKATSLQQQYQILQQTYTALEKNYAQIEAKLENQQQQLIDVEKAKNEHLQTSLHWQNQYKENQQSLDGKTTQLIDIQAEAKILSQQVLDTRQSLNDVLDQNKLLGHEKWILAQEKAQLEGQLKQMLKIVSV
jgi:DNA repair exonuclease SbcCD ATPase subunit